MNGDPILEKFTVIKEINAPLMKSFNHKGELNKIQNVMKLVQTSAAKEAIMTVFNIFKTGIHHMELWVVETRNFAAETGK